MKFPALVAVSTPVRSSFGACFLKLGVPAFCLALLASALSGCAGLPNSAVPSAPAPAAPSTPAAPATNTFSNLHQQSGWTGYALLPSAYLICASCVPSGPHATWLMTQGVGSPSLSGSAAQMDIGGQVPYADILWNNHLIGDFSSQALPDKNRTLNPSLHTFVYDVQFYATNLGASQALEFDINQFVNGLSFIWGHECRIAGGHEWDIWDNQGQKWVATGVPCNPVNNAWNHVVLQVQRTSDNRLLYQSITFNGVTSTLNHFEDPTATNWYGITVNYQQDGNYRQEPYSIWLDKLNFSYR
jgi:hypothetical protein